MSETWSRELAESRWEKLRGLLREARILRVEDLSEQLHVSPATVRRDLAALESRGEIRRVHGGAVAVDEADSIEPLFDDKTAIAADQKQRIAEAAVKLVKPRDVVYLDGGSTVLALARLLQTRTDITVVTNSLRVALLFSGGGPRMILTGGECRMLSQTFVGPLTRPVLEAIHIDIAFMGTIGLSVAGGMTTTDPDEALTKETALARSRRRILLADAGKFQKTSFVRFGLVADLTAVITDTAMPPDQRKAFAKLDVELIVV